MAGVASVRSGIEAHCHSVYYRAMKKTLTPLNDVYMRRAQHTPRARDNMIDQHEDVLNQQAKRQRAQAANVPKTAME